MAKEETRVLAKGTTFLYYGQEIGMVDNLDLPPDKIQDKAVVKSETGKLPPPRDGARTPMQWNDSANAGFSFAKDVKPWLPVHQNYLEVNVDQQLKEPDSIFNFYRQLIKARKNSEALRIGSWRTLIHYSYEHLAYLRETPVEKVLVIIIFPMKKIWKWMKIFPEKTGKC